MTHSNPLLKTSQPNIPVITIDGPSGVGKGTLSGLVARHFGWNYLDSGALYRITAYAAIIEQIDLTDPKNSEAEISKLALSLNIQFKNNGEILLDNNYISQQIRTQECGNNASIIAALPKVREALLQKQKDFCTAPGLVADGRDMGTVVFPQAISKIFLTASAQERGTRRYKQLQNYNENAKVSGSLEIITSIEEIIAEIERRDERDMNRSVSPLIPAKDAIVIDTSNMSIDEVFNKILTLCQLQ